VTLSAIKIKSLWIPACAGMTALAFIVFMFLCAVFIVFPIHGNGLTTPTNYFMGRSDFK